MKAFDIAFKDMTRSFRSFFAVVFMFIVPLLVTGMFYFMFGNIASNGGFNLPRTRTWMKADPSSMSIPRTSPVAGKLTQWVN